ncbi:MAG: homoserine dehydrogenase [Armatimonadota bacterium]|nr:homoserine dehydrogenase [Armatimonadota bacterium]MCX7776636.1 homoserine dehydrogenase [Armatimonadota bacterium]MDW8025221.1 homoserine dehydrogenase [Armatimonadota bacterium]
MRRRNGLAIEMDEQENSTVNSGEKQAAVRIGMLGLGTVGSAVIALLWRNRELIQHRAGCQIEVVRVAVRQLDKERPVILDPRMLTDSAYEVIEDERVDVVVELIGGVEPAYEYVMRAIELGKSVVTANKELLAKRGGEILDAAKEKCVDVYFEASVGGGIPIIMPLKQSLVGNRIKRIVGILNGTTNYILTRMTKDGVDFAAALSEAQMKGFAEADPTDDVDAFDPMYKIAILASIAFGYRIPLDAIYREGIRHIGPADIDYANSLGYVIKLLAIAAEHDGMIELRVHPTLVPKTHPLASVSDNYNAVVIEGDSVGRLMFYGQGAGGAPTASAVVGDIVDAARNIRLKARGRIPCVCRVGVKVKSVDDVVSRFCVRMKVADKPGVLAKIAGVFGAEGVSIASVVQRESDGKSAEIVWITHSTPYRSLREALDGVSSLDVVYSVGKPLWVEAD